MAKISQEISINTHGVDKNRIELILSIIAGGNKLSSLVVFYGASNRPKEKEIRNHELVKQ